MNFTEEQLKLISRALNFYAAQPVQFLAGELKEDPDESRDLSRGIYQAYFKLGR